MGTQKIGLLPTDQTQQRHSGDFFSIANKNIQ